MTNTIRRLISAAKTQIGLGNFSAAAALIEQAELIARDLGEVALATDLFNLYVAAKARIA